MLSNLSRMDRAGVLLCALLLGSIVFLWWIGWAALTALFVTFLFVAVFLIGVVWIANRNDEDPNNDGIDAAVTEMKDEAAAAWQKAGKAVRGE